jgi:hypothetical protein
MKKKKQSDEFTIPEYQALVLWAFSEAAASYKLKVEVEFHDNPKVKTLLLDGHDLPIVQSVRIPKISDNAAPTAEDLNILIEES